MKIPIFMISCLLLLLSSCLPPTLSEAQIQTAIAQTVVANKTQEVTQTNADSISNSSGSTDKCFPPAISGISYESISEYLGEKGIYCNPMQRDAVSFSTTCEGETKDGSALIWVEVYSGNRPEDIYLILSYVDQSQGFPSNELASEILGFIAAIPYQNSEPIKAQTWVKNNLSKVTVDSSYEPIEFIGGVRFHMSCHMDILNCLAIGFSQSEYDCSNPPIISEYPTSVPERIITDTINPSPEVIVTSTSTPFQIPGSIVKQGNGNAIIRFEKWNGPALIHMTGIRKIKGYLFFVSSWGKGFYDGVRILDIFPDVSTSSLEIESDGEWQIEIIPINTENLGDRLLSIPGKYNGNGDDVVFIDGNDLYQAVIKGNSERTNFIVMAYGENAYHEEELLVNVIDVYEGTIDLPDWIRMLEVEAFGPWSIEITKR